MRIIYLLSVVLLMAACTKKNKAQDPSPEEDGNGSTAKGLLLMHLHNYVDDSEVDGYNIVYTTSEGRKVLLTRAQLYLSGFELVKLDGSLYPIPDKYILKTQENQVYQLGEVPVGNYKTIRFKVGLNPAVNASTPSNDATDILNKAEMWFTNTAQPDGYVFLHLAGKIDTTTAANAAVADMKPFQYRIGTNAQYRQVVIPDQNFSVLEGQAGYLHMYVNQARMFDGVQLNNEANLMLTTPSDNATGLGTILGNNMSNLFFYE